MIRVRYFETHVGHNIELRSRRLTKSEQQTVAEKLIAGVSVNRIIQDARKIENSTLERINIMSRGDLAYLMRKFNIYNQRDKDDMIATALKVEEWNKDGRNYAFLFKQIGLVY